MIPEIQLTTIEAGRHQATVNKIEYQKKREALLVTLRVDDCEIPLWFPMSSEGKFKHEAVKWKYQNFCKAFQGNPKTPEELVGREAAIELEVTEGNERTFYAIRPVA